MANNNINEPAILYNNTWLKTTCIDLNLYRDKN